MISVELVDIAKTYGSVVAISNVSLTFNQGKFYSLLGPSGCGKTTILRIIAGFITPDSGDVYIMGKRVNNLPPYKRNVGMIFQSYALWPHMTIYENIAFGLEIHHIKDKAELKKRVMEVLEVVHLSGFEQRYPNELSGGQQQRVAMARIIAIKPATILFDEPLSNLDRKLRMEMQVELKLLQNKLGITAIYVTHDQEEALSLSDQIMVMSVGKIEQIGAPMDIYDNPRNKYVANFIGTVNFFEGKVISIISNSLIKVRIDNNMYLLVPYELNHIEEGSDVITYVRPEKSEIFIEKPILEENVFTGIVKYITYQGSSARYGIQLSNGREIIIDKTLAIKQYGQNEKVYLKLYPKFLCKK